MTRNDQKKWLLLIHQIPPKPNALRVKIWRRLQQVGAVAIKQSVYAMPFSEQSREDLSWILKEIVGGGGDGSISEARFVEGLTDEQVMALFQKSRLRRRLDEVGAIDFFQAPEWGTAEILIKDLAARLSGQTSAAATVKDGLDNLKGKTWVTRKNLFVDRIACGWLIRRFVDNAAVFKFVDATPYAPAPDEFRFDMFDGEYTHEGDRCSFEVMIQRLQLQDRALVPLAEVVHDIDLKDTKYDRSETDGFNALLTGLVASRPNDDQRMAEGYRLFENLYAYFQRHKGAMC
ncbi:MAG: chromate resistance protein [Desulfosarcina sp.]|nr:chromate resistance protein [Desulfosarcina sp.]MBC2767263.1 chromate resistance protein [Desulfosarcina sp.]